MHFLKFAVSPYLLLIMHMYISMILKRQQISESYGGEIAARATPFSEWKMQQVQYIYNELNRAYDGSEGRN